MRAEQSPAPTGLHPKNSSMNRRRAVCIFCTLPAFFVLARKRRENGAGVADGAAKSAVY